MNEEFAIKLKTILDTSSLQAVKTQLEQFSNKASEALQTSVKPAQNAQQSLGVSQEDIDMAEGYSARIAYIISQINDLKEKRRLIDLGAEEGDILKIEADIETLSAKLKNLTDPKGLAVVQKTTVNIKNDLKSAVKQASRFVLALVGVRGLYGSIRKAMSSYLAQNEELQQKLNGAWYALGSLFAPVLEKVISLFVYLVSLVDAFVKSLGLAGVNMDKYGKSAGKASKITAGFDEINNINQNGGGAGGMFALDKVGDDALNKFKSLLAVISAIGAGLASWKIAEGIASLFGKTLDPTTLWGISLAVGGVVLAIASLLNYLDNPSWFNFGGIITGIGTAFLGVGLILGNFPLIVTGVITAILGLLAMFWPQIQEGINIAIEWIDNKIDALGDSLHYWLGWVGDIIFAWINDAWNRLKNFINMAVALLNSFFTGTKQILDGIIRIFKGDFQGGIRQVGEGIKTIFRGVLNVLVGLANGLLSMAENAINSIANALNSIHVTIPSWIPYVGGKSFSVNIPTVSLPRVPALEVGTNYVPNDMLAEIHEGEAVIPKEFNSEEYFNNDETNELLERLINVVESKEFRAYISQSEVGKAATKYINQQSRIMGGSLI